MFKAIIFDFDDTLTDRGELYRKFSRYIIGKYFDSPDNIDEISKHMVEIDNRGYSNRDKINQEIINRWKLSVSKEELENEMFTVGSTFTTLEENVFEVLEYLKQKYKLGIITNGLHILQNSKIIASGLAKYFDDIIISGDVNIHKPDKEIFLMSCNNLGVKPDETVFIGDKLEYDINGAVNAGLKAILYNKHSNDTYENVISNLLELKRIF